MRHLWKKEEEQPPTVLFYQKKEQGTRKKEQSRPEKLAGGHPPPWCKTSLDDCQMLFPMLFLDNAEWRQQPQMKLEFRKRLPGCWRNAAPRPEMNLEAGRKLAGRELEKDLRGEMNSFR